MNYYLTGAAVLAGLLGLGHSLLGEKTILGPLFTRNDLPKLMGSAEFTKQTLRFTWHVTTALLWGLAGILWLLACGTPDGILTISAWTLNTSVAVTIRS